MKVQIEVTDEQIANSLISAFEGGSNYWYMIESTHAPKGDSSKWKYRTDKKRVYSHIDYPMNAGGWLLISSLEEPDKGKFKLDRKAIERGVQLLANSKTYQHHFHDMLTENDDAITGDVLLQFCLFGDVLYG